jgi:hypothetical protein
MVPALCFIRFYAGQLKLITSESHLQRPSCRIAGTHIMVFPNGPTKAYEALSNLSGRQQMCLNVLLVVPTDLETVTYLSDFTYFLIHLS